MAERAGRIGKPPLVEPHHLGTFDFLQQMDVVRCYHNGRAQPVQCRKKLQQPHGHVGIDIACGFVRDKDLGSADYRARNRHPLLYAARKRRGVGP